MAGLGFNLGKFQLTAEGEKVLSELGAMNGKRIDVGFLQDAPAYPDGTSVIDVAAFNEYGNSRTPPRPFMLQAWEARESELENACTGALTLVSNGSYTAEQAANLVGAVWVGVIQQEIRDGDFAPNAPMTIQRKGSSHPLIDTGHMWQSIHYEVKG